MTRPITRRHGLLVRELGEETIVYDCDRHQAHCLNGTAARVFRLCDGARTPEQVAAALREAMPEAGQDPGVPEALALLALDRLSDAHLLAEEGAPRDASRRELMRRVGLAAVALPLIVSVLAPKPAEAATCLTQCNPPDDTGKACTCGPGACGVCLDTGSCTAPSCP